MHKNVALSGVVGLIFFLSQQGLAQSAKSPADKTPYFFDQHMLNLNAVLPSAPAEDSENGLREHEMVIEIQKVRTLAEVKAAQKDDEEEDTRSALQSRRRCSRSARSGAASACWSRRR